MQSLSRVTDPPGHHFFGYYEKSPWNADGRYLLAHEVAFQDRRPTAEDAAGICLLDRETGKSDRLTETRAWDFQQGAMLQWLGPEYDRRFVFNDRTADGFVTRVHDVYDGRIRTLEAPIYAVAPDGTMAYSLDYDRLDYTRPGYGYAPISSDVEPPPHPDSEGVYRIDLSNGSTELLVSLQDLYEFDAVESMGHGTHWVNHVQLSPRGTRVAFIHRSETADDRRWLDRLFSMNADGTNLELLHSGYVSHYDWRTETELLAWTDHDDEAYYRYGLDGSIAPLGRGVLPRDGHCSFSPNGEWLLLDSSPDENRRRGLYLYHLDREELIELGSVYSPPVEASSLRCDLHPRWDRAGEKICFDSTHEGTRQMYVVDVSEHTS